MLDLRDPKRVVVEGEKGYYFNSMPSKRTLAQMTGLEQKFMFTVIGMIVFLMVGIILVPSFLEEDPFFILFITLFTALVMEVFILIVAIMLRIERWKERRKKAKGIQKPEIKLYDYVKVFDSVMILYFNMVFYERTNVIPIGDVKAVHLDAPGFLKSKGVRLPVLYGPFRKKAPNALNYPGSLYSNFPPLDHLVRIEMRRPVKIKGWNPKLKSIKSLTDPFAKDTVRSVDDLIISIRPADQRRFKEVMDRVIAGHGP